MYTKPIAYKIYSIIMLALSLTSAVYTFVGYSVLSGLLTGYTGYKISVPLTIIMPVSFSVFVAFIEFTSMFTFAQMIEHEQQGSAVPFKRMGIVLPPGFYKMYGTIMYFLTSTCQAIGLIAIIVIGFITRLKFWPFFWILVGALIINAAFNALCYLQFYCKYRTFGDLLAVKSSKMVLDDTIQSLGKDNPNHLRGFCIFLYGFGIFSIAVSIISILFIGVAGVFLTLAAFLCFIPLSVIGCYFDNLAKMLEHYMIKYKLI